MAWNDVKQSTNKAIHLLVTIGGKNGRSFNFRQATDIKVERKIGDTMSKFSLGIIDDSGSDQRSDYVEFERYLIHNFVEIEIAYGNTYSDMQKFTGFVVDYQPVFFGSTTKLTVTGYLTKVRGNTSKTKLTSPYSYWYDWTPYMGVRGDTTEDWDKLYDENGLIFNDGMKQAAINLGADFSTITQDTEISDAELMSKISDLVSTENKAFSEANSAYEKTLTNWLKSNWNTALWRVEDNFKGYSEEGTRFDKLHINWDNNNPTVEIKYTNSSTGISTTYVRDLRDFVTRSGISEYLGVNGFNGLLEAQGAYSQKVGLLMGLAKQDMIDEQEALGEFRGAVPFHPEIMNKYTGNVKFDIFEHDSTKRKLYRVRPDLFVKWDNEVPLTALGDAGKDDIDAMSSEEYKKWTNTFSDHVVCDIKIFGLRYKVNHTKLKSGAIKEAYTLYPKDRWGTHRVLDINGTYYIWVGDAPELWQKFKDSEDFNYQSQKVDPRKFNKKEDTIGKTEVYWAAEKEYHIGEIVVFNEGYADDMKGHVKAEVVENFTTAPNPELNFWWDVADFFVGNSSANAARKGLKKLWDQYLDTGEIRGLDQKYDNYEELDLTDLDIRDYKIEDLREKDQEIGWINDKSKEERGAVKSCRDSNGNKVSMDKGYRIKTYLQSTYRSAMPLAYGQIRISDIVKQLAYLEEWDDNEITSTTASDFKSSFLAMNGQSALEYISETLGPEAVEAGGGRVGFTTYFDNNKFIFKPANMHYSGGIVYETGYNRKDSDVLSFTVRSRGLVLMNGVDDNISNLNAYTNEQVAATSKSKQDLTMHSEEAKLRQELAVYTNDSSSLDNIFFNLPLYYYYGNSTNKVSEFANFVGNIGSYSSIKSFPFASQTMIETNKSSSSSSQQVIAQALNDIEKIKNTCIQAEMTIMGNTHLTPGQWITVNNYTKRGPHYTSGDYFIQSITDQVTAGGAFTQNLSMYRFGYNVAAMNSGNTHLEAGMSLLRKYDMTKFSQWIQTYYPDIADKYNVVIDPIANKVTTSVEQDSKLSGNEHKKNYKKINGIECYGEIVSVEMDTKYNESHEGGWWHTYAYTESATYVIYNEGKYETKVIRVGSVYDYVSYDGSFKIDKYGNQIREVS